MNILVNTLIVIATFFFMEFMAWFTHKYVMHGFLWYLHRDHHQGKEGFFEKNDSFFLIFAVPSAIHQRFKIWRNWNNRYVLGIRRAHKIHHKYLGKEDGENFGMLIVPMRYFKLNYKERN